MSCSSRLAYLASLLERAPGERRKTHSWASFSHRNNLSSKQNVILLGGIDQLKVMKAQITGQEADLSFQFYMDASLRREADV